MLVGDLLPFLRPGIPLVIPLPKTSEHLSHAVSPEAGIHHDDIGVENLESLTVV